MIREWGWNPSPSPQFISLRRGETAAEAGVFVLAASWFLVASGLAACVVTLMGRLPPHTLAGWPVASLWLVWFVGAAALLWVRHTSGISRASVVWLLLLWAVPGGALATQQLQSADLLLKTPIRTVPPIAFLALLGLASFAAPGWAELRRAMKMDCIVMRHAWPPVLPILLAGALASSWALTSAGERSQIALPPGDGARFQGPPFTTESPVTLLSFVDYECPPCRLTAAAYRPVLTRFQDKVAVATVHFPLDQTCNPTVTRTMHPHACEMAVAVSMAARQGRRVEMESWLYQDAGTPSRERLWRAAAEVGQVTDPGAAYPAALESVRQDIALGLRHGVTGTPTFFLNGVNIGAPSAERLEDLLALEIKRVRLSGR